MGLVGLLSASITEVDSTTLPLLVVPALAAAMFGRFTSFLTTFIAGVIIGMAESILLYFSTLSWFPTDGGIGNPLPGVQELLIFIVLVIAMFLRAGKIPGRGDSSNGGCRARPARGAAPAGGDLGSGRCVRDVGVAVRLP